MQNINGKRLLNISKIKIRGPILQYNPVSLLWV